MAVASSSTTSFDPRRRQVFPADPRLPSTRPSRISENERRSVGVMANRMAASSERAQAKADTRRFKPRSRRNGVRAIMATGIRWLRVCIVHLAEAMPSTLAVPTSRRPSVTNWRNNRTREAPQCAADCRAPDGGFRIARATGWQHSRKRSATKARRQRAAPGESDGYRRR